MSLVTKLLLLCSLKGGESLSLNSVTEYSSTGLCEDDDDEDEGNGDEFSISPFFKDTEFSDTGRINPKWSLLMLDDSIVCKSSRRELW